MKTPQYVPKALTLDAAELPNELTDAEIDAFVARLDDDGVRRILIAQLQGVVDEQAAAAQFVSDGFVVALERNSVKLRERLGEVLSARRIFGRFFPDR